jgi:hypothetical protein
MTNAERMPDIDQLRELLAEARQYVPPTALKRVAPAFSITTGAGPDLLRPTVTLLSAIDAALAALGDADD